MSAIPKVMQKKAWTPRHKCHMRFSRKDVLKDHTKGKEPQKINTITFLKGPMVLQSHSKTLTKKNNFHFFFFIQILVRILQ